MSKEVPNAYNEDTVAAAGEWLVSLCGRDDSFDTTRALTQLEQAKFDEFFTLHEHSPVFKPYHVEGVRKCLRKRWKPDYQLARSLLDKDDTGNLFAEETDILQVAIQVARIEPGWLGNSPKESCPELIEMVELLISHGASPSCLDGDGNSALSYACILGYPELFHFLVSAGALLSTMHPRRLPEQLGKPDDSLNQQDNNVNLLQVTLDALISPQHIVDMTWVGWPPGVNYDRPLWESDLDSTWGGIILHLLKAGLSYAKDDPGLIMLLHIACYEGELGYVEQLLEFDVVTNVAGPRMVDGGQGKGSSYGTALHAAAANKQLSSAKLLVAHGESPRTRAPCISRYDRSTEDITPTEIALSMSRYQDDDTETLFTFLEGLMQHEQGLEDSDHQKILLFCARHNHIDFVTSLLQRGVLPEKVPSNVGSAQMAQLLISHGASIDAAAVQKKALNAGKLSLLRWCVDEYGSQLVSDPETWGNMGYRMLNCGLMYLENIKYLASEYPGSHIDAVLVANLSLGDEDPKPTPTSWLHMAALRDNIWALEMLLKAGADPTCPGLTVDVSTAIRQSRQYKYRSIPERLKVIQMLESYNCKDGDWRLPSYEELKVLLADTTAKQKLSWEERLEDLVESQQALPFAPTQQNSASVSTASVAASSEFAYRPLHNKSAIRLLELFPSDNRAEPLLGRLIESDLTLQPDYEAVSYVWGDTNINDCIELDEQAVSITANLHSALVHIRDASDVRTLWVDALCIDQSTHAERNQQVTIMGDIYKSARQVLVWLGEAADDSHLVFEYLKDDANNTFPNLPRPPAQYRQAWKALVRRPWFFRTWVIQEVALSRKAIIMCGEESAPWKDLGSGHRADISGGALGLSSVSSAPGYKADHPFVGFDNDSHVWRLRMLRPGSHPAEVVQYSRACQSSEVRDRVYGLLGLFDPGFMAVDYDLPVEDIFRQFTEAAIRRTGDLGILKWFGVGPLSKSLPSWVPDFTDTVTVGTLPQRRWYHSYQDGGEDGYSYRTADGTRSKVSPSDVTGNVLPGLAFRPDGLLAIKGKIIDTIRAIGPELSAGTTFAPGTESFARIMKEWESLAATLTTEWNTSLASSVSTAFAATISAAQPVELRSVDVGFVQWYRHNGSGVLEAADPALFIREHEFYLWWLGVGKEKERKGNYNLGYEFSEFADKMELACYGRCFFTTEKGNMGLAGPQAHVGDQIVYLPGGDQAFVLRRRDDGGWTMAHDCYLHGLDPYALFNDEEHLVEEFLIH
ncbi:uncharacterized protein NECHADRAFT_95927 [Fusarium vanettenii 77-13-4]|uniref:Heterokaryon incompatibility domain-containing protein n=1 Tax=Fusarium vanettenii (strain ATCC MYA-4622 / CBS 123669 / FGSC 9596 / NRRL 45880 / 77-13-4) TaxID=660122 RepID=C7ZCW1_FUSV7|nr:uncharacterized protein NECHADRAFT_95927 [Fusarium vanettenii 77-13-4]EEU37988.1 hypothetical protein NECHADRAFT_95927 [Fusarium vanettenii 77-13-4]